jgi:hypothetical protein
VELVRRGLVRPAAATDGGELYRFHHALVRDVAYGGLPKADRAALHETYADWLADQPEGDDEMLGYHLEQAYRYRIELGESDRRARQLAFDAGAALGKAGMRAWRRSDVPSTIDLLDRATTMLAADDPWRRELLCELGVAFAAAGDTTLAEKTVGNGLAAARDSLDARVGYRAQLELAYVGIQRDPEGKDEELLDVAEKGLPLFEELGDDRSLGRAWLLSGYVRGGVHGQHAEWEEAAERALGYYRASGFPPGTCLGQIAAALYYGPAPVERAIARCEELVLEAGIGPIGRANVLRYLGGLVAMAGDAKRGAALVVEAAASFEELGQVGAAKYSDSVLGDIALLTGDLERARSVRESVCAYCQASGDVGYLGSTGSWLAEVVYLLGDYRAAQEWIDVARRHVASNDLLGQIAWRSVESRLLAERGDAEQALRVSHEAVARADATDALNAHADALISHADVLRTVKRADDADRAVTAALELYERKGNVAARARHKALAAR